MMVPASLGAEREPDDEQYPICRLRLSIVLPNRRTPQEIARIVYGTGSEAKPGGFYPHGANGRIARSLL
ncbi:hypothetical protein CDL15_Pgr019469 [Punica granatum]|uniref:Uncharacterized protein n=1 Tax=Punica granatum TaxID=22663 RepID=A0A218VTX8_PUNGR|nr:hypothetical protein CDL15_Pgr019469 [Punica granatum]